MHILAPRLATLLIKINAEARGVGTGSEGATPCAFLTSYSHSVSLYLSINLGSINRRQRNTPETPAAGSNAPTAWGEARQNPSAGTGRKRNCPHPGQEFCLWKTSVLLIWSPLPSKCHNPATGAFPQQAFTHFQSPGAWELEPAC